VGFEWGGSIKIRRLRGSMGSMGAGPIGGTVVPIQSKKPIKQLQQTQLEDQTERGG